jgi:hypothetical protein
MMAATSGRALVTRGERARVLALVDALAAARPVVRGASPSATTLMRGVAGRLLLEQERRAAGDPGADTRRLARLRRLLAARVATVPLDASLFDGLLGVAWLAARDGELDASAWLDARLVAILAEPWRGPLDLVGGLAGVGAFLLREGATQPARAALASVVTTLEQRAVSGRGGLTWIVTAESLTAEQLERTPGGRYELGMAHGVAGLLPVLAGAVAARVEPARAARLLEGAVAWLVPLARRRDAPAALALDGTPQPPMGGWCRGALGVGLGLWAAGRTVDDPALAKTGAAIALAGLDAVNPDEACLCHGTAGAALAAHALHDATGHDAFARAARAHLARCLARIGRPGALAPAARPGEGLLFGGTGVALALLAATRPRVHSWWSLFVGRALVG